jgi:two-component system, NarL family, response regulator
MEPNGTNPVRILIVDDHPVMCSGLSNMLGMHEEIVVIGSAGSGAEALKIIDLEKPDLMLLDLRMPGIDGISVLQKLQKIPESPKVVVLTSYAQDELIYQAIKAGAWGYLLKDTSEDELIAAITAVHAGRRYIPVGISSRLAERMTRSDLTPRELQTLELLAEGYTNKQIATALKLSDYTIRHYVNNLMEKLQAADRTGAVAAAFRSGLLQRLDRQ